MLWCPVRKKNDGSAEEPNEFELNFIRNDPDKLISIRMRLSDISWWMRLLLACSAYVDLNPIRAVVA